VNEQTLVEGIGEGDDHGNQEHHHARPAKHERTQVLQGVVRAKDVKKNFMNHLEAQNCVDRFAQPEKDEINFEIVLPADEVIKYKEALIMALLGALRWREQYTVLSSATGASRNSIGGALWLGSEA